MTDRELMQMVLEELEELADVNYGSKTVLQALRDRLAQPEPPATIWLTFHEPPMVFRDREDALAFCQDGEQPIPMYSSPLTQPVHAIDISEKRVDETAKDRHEPIAWLSKCYNDDNEFLGYTLWNRDVGEECFPVYTASSKREWVGLTDEEVWGLVAFEGASLADFVQAIEAKLKEKNT